MSSDRYDYEPREALLRSGIFECTRLERYGHVEFRVKFRRHGQDAYWDDGVYFDPEHLDKQRDKDAYVRTALHRCEQRLVQRIRSGSIPTPLPKPIPNGPESAG